MPLPTSIATLPDAPPKLALQRDTWPDRAAAFRASSGVRAAMQLVTTLVPLAAVLTVMYFGLATSYWITLALAPLAAGFYVRTFILMHDCAHGSFTPSRRANEIIGVVTGFITMTPFAQWRRDHALHHASSGDLDRRGHGDIDTLTVDEYLARNGWGRFKYRLSRHPLVMLGLGPLYIFVHFRLPPSKSNTRAARVGSVHATNAALLALFLAVAFAIGWGPLLLVYVPVLFLASASGIWLFYVQHQFEGAYWEPHGEWKYEAAALHGSSYYRLPRILEWFTGSIGLHHVHHVDPRIPNYQLRRCHEAIPEFHGVTQLTVRDSLRTLSLKLWDPTRRRLVGFDAVRSARQPDEQ